MILFCLLVTVMPMIRHPLWSDFIGDLTVIKYLGIACLIYAVLYLPARATSLRLFATWQVRFFVAWALLVMFLFLRYGDARLPFEVSRLIVFLSATLVPLAAAATQSVSPPAPGPIGGGPR